MDKRIETTDNVYLLFRNSVLNGDKENIEMYSQFLMKVITSFISGSKKRKRADIEAEAESKKRSFDSECSDDGYS